MLYIDIDLVVSAIRSRVAWLVIEIDHMVYAWVVEAY